MSQHKQWFHGWSRIGWAKSLAATVLLMSALGVAACQPIQPPAVNAAEVPAAPAAEVPAITIHARDFAFDMPAELPSGWVSLTLANEGEVNHHAIVVRLKDGVTFEQFVATLDDEDDSLGDQYFFMPDTDPGASNEATVKLVPGTWAIFSVSMDGGDDPANPVPDWALGSLAQFAVVDTGTEAAPPEADLVLTLGADDVDVPAEVSAGSHTVQIVADSDGVQPWAFFLRLGEGVTMDDVLGMFDALFSGQSMDTIPMAEFHVVGGLMGNDLGDSFYTTLDLTPGTYTVITSIGNTGFPYAGLSKTFTVK